MHVTRTTILMAAALLCFLPRSSDAAQPEAWPFAWRNDQTELSVEIEAKWNAADAALPICTNNVPNDVTINRIIAAFPNGGTYSTAAHTYFVNVRWTNAAGEGISRQFVDLYYDSDDRELSRRLHVLRHRTRSQLRNPEPVNNCPDALAAAGERFDWERVEYKATPFIFTPAWFRQESGADCNVNDRQGEDLCEERSVPDILEGRLSSHPAINYQTGLLGDHPGFYERSGISAAEPFLQVVQFRYRIELCLTEPCSDDNAVYELTLDQVTSTPLPAGASTFSVEIEVEHVETDLRTEEDVLELFAIAEQLETAFGLVPSFDSKGGVVAHPVIVVTKVDDTADGSCDEADCSLREAIVAANADPGFDVITVPAGTYVLRIPGREESAGATGDLDIADSLTVAGAGGAATTVIDGARLDRVFHVHSGAIAELGHLTITRGAAVHAFGGGISASGHTILAIRSSIVAGNSAGEGGGIEITGGVNLVSNSTIRDNTATLGGGIECCFTFQSHSLFVSNSTIAHNRTASSGSALWIEAGGGTILNTTITDNVSEGFVRDGWLGGDSAGEVRFVSSSIVRNSSPRISPAGPLSVEIQSSAFDALECDGSGFVTIASLGHNLFGGSPNCDLTLLPSDLTVLGDLGLGAFTDSGVPGQGHVPLLDTSPAIDTGDDAACPITDQLGTRRGDIDGVGTSICDIGAVEFVPVLNDDVSLDDLQTSCCSQFTIDATFTYNGAVPVKEPFFQVSELSGGNVVANADGGAGGVGARVSVFRGPGTDVLQPGTTFTVRFVIDLRDENAFRFFVNFYGVPLSGS
jgi:CSLREA domain-containing protein